ncbi:potassium transporter TrkG [Jannaschia aquimarina]|uniref:TrkG protein n=1 Tax=Jannaschia aquimarina TaxID=935700 RepID=A0A0D1CTV0_9RHOB|nr:potassium transporter TrkG [Jannaschia aquimarina]KIT18197.1 Trk system potassium uptake protein TrkG [Jannaschia aquimarina]SNT40165.1 trk system potassium uptake protein TrkH [Jannaschia aquimarina]
MGGALGRLPLLVVLAGVLALSMQVPALHALTRDAHAEARAFFYWSAIFLALVTGVAVVARRPLSANLARSHLVALVGAFAGLPLMAMMPVTEIVRDTSAINLYTEMVAAATTTGGSLYDPDRLSQSVHLWRAMVAWQGGLMVWIAAVAVLAPLRLGGFEVTWSDRAGQSARLSIADQRRAPGERLWRYARTLTPVYVGLTLALWMLLAFGGSGQTEAAIRAMSTMSTSGIVGQGDAPGFWGEIAIFAFLLFAVSRLTFAGDLHREQVARLARDRELRMAFMLVSAVTLVLFGRHWIGIYDLTAEQPFTAGLEALWGAAFTTLSFLTTTGFESQSWSEARTWSGLEQPGVLLVGLAMFGGGVATTAGGVKLLRVYALYAHGRREMSLLIHPHSVGSHSPDAMRLPVKGTEAAWVFFMLFATSIAVTTLALGATGLEFREAVVLASAALTTTGPLADVAMEGGVARLTDTAKLVFVAAMVVGRLEALALIALFNPDFWRR